MPDSSYPHGLAPNYRVPFSGAVLEETVRPEVEETVISSSESESTGGGEARPREEEERTVDICCMIFV